MGSAAPHALELSGVSKRYRDVIALRGVDLALAPGTVLALIGANGAGKSTLISIIAGLRRPDEGTVHVRPPVGLAPQDLGVYPSVTVQANLELFGALAGLGRREQSERIEWAAGALGLTSLVGHQVRDLSGGQKRRLHVAIAVLARPPVVLLDEPATSLDPSGRDALVAMVGELAAGGSAVLYATNRVGEAESLPGSVAVLDEGRLVAMGSLAEVEQVARSAAPPPVPADLEDLQARNDRVGRR